MHAKSRRGARASLDRHDRGRRSRAPTRSTCCSATASRSCRCAAPGSRTARRRRRPRRLDRGAIAARPRVPRGRRGARATGRGADVAAARDRRHARCRSTTSTARCSRTPRSSSPTSAARPRRADAHRPARVPRAPPRRSLLEVAARGGPPPGRRARRASAAVAGSATLAERRGDDRPARLRPARRDLDRRPLAAARARGRASGRVPDGAQDRLLRRGRVFEYWAHEACLIPVARLARTSSRACATAATTSGSAPVLEQQSELVDDDPRDGAPSAARSRPATSAAPAPGYWNWSDAEARCSRRCGRPDSSWSPAAAASSGATTCPSACCRDEVLDAPDPSPVGAARATASRARVRARGLRARGRACATTTGCGAAGSALAPTIEALVGDGVLARVRLARERRRRARRAEPTSSCCVAGPDAPTRRLPALARSTTCCGIASRPSALFGFDHRLEIYKRPHERIYGYYVLPLRRRPRDRRARRREGRSRPPVSCGRSRCTGKAARGHERCARRSRASPGRSAWNRRRSPDGVRDARDPRRTGARPADGLGQRPDLPDVDLRPGRRRRQMRGGHDYARTHQPDAHRARGSASPRSSRPSTASPSRRACRRSRPSSSCLAGPARRWRSTTSTAAPTGCSRRCSPRRATASAYADLTDAGRPRARSRPSGPPWSGSRRRRTRC